MIYFVCQSWQYLKIIKNCPDFNEKSCPSSCLNWFLVLQIIHIILRIFLNCIDDEIIDFISWFYYFIRNHWQVSLSIRLIDIKKIIATFYSTKLGRVRQMVNLFGYPLEDPIGPHLLQRYLSFTSYLVKEGGMCGLSNRWTF